MAATRKVWRSSTTVGEICTGPPISSAPRKRPTASSAKPGIEEQPARREQQQEAQVPPAVAERAQVRRRGCGRPC